MEKKQMVWPFLAIVAIVAIVGVVMLVMNFKGSSSEVGVSEEGALAGEAISYDLYCDDTDPQNNPYLKGKVTKKSEIRYDMCRTTTELLQFNCGNYTTRYVITNTSKVCLPGEVCRDGACFR